MENQDPERKSRINLSLRNKFTLQKRDTRSLKPEPADPADNTKPVSYLGAENSASTSSHGLSNGVVLSENNDSLCDFRSPIKDELNESLADFRVKPTTLKSNKRLQVRKESKPVAKKKRRNRDVAANANQPSIESSFFKPQTPVQTAFLCPLCFKSCKDLAARHSHMKICAAKNKISTDKLLDAVELQEKQARERTALGLLAAPQIQPKKTVSKKLISDQDPQLQLALALSMSLHEAQATEEIENAHLLAGEAFTPINTEMSEERRKTLQNFGFTTNKPMLTSTSARSRKKRPAGPTVLQNRTQEERDRLLTVRIAEVLMGDEAITQAMMEDVEKVLQSEENIVLNSRLLRSYHCLKDRLWDKTQQSLSPRLYSCKFLGLSPSNEKPEDQVKELEQDPFKFESPEPGTSNAPDVVYVDNENVISPPTTLEFIPKRSTIANKTSTEKLKHNTDRNSVLNLSRDWGSMVGQSHMSDITIITKGGGHIHAHHIVLWARCPDILYDVTQHDPENFLEMQNRILWPETDTLSAYGFLEYVYSGVIYKHLIVFNHPEMLTGVRALARKYKLKKLFTYLRDKAIELKSMKTEESKNEINAESNRDEDANDSSSNLGEDESSNSSLEIDMNSQNTICINVTSNNRVAKERDSESNNQGSRNIRSPNLQGENNNSHNLIVDCLSGSNDSLGTHIPESLKSSKSVHEKFSDRMSQKIPANVANDIKNHEPSDRENDNNHKVQNIMLEDTRCTSPDIFDDSTTECSPYNNAELERPCDTEHNKNFNNPDIDNSLINSPYSNKETDKTADTSQQNNSRKSIVDFTFVSTRRRGRSIKLISHDDSNSNVECDLVKENSVSTPSLRPKGDITMAIEKMQRLNAKTASESDSECELTEILPIRRPKNPFRINATNTSSMIEETKSDDVEFGSDDEVPLKTRNKLSIFEKMMQLEAAKNPAMFNLTTFKPAADVDSKNKSSQSQNRKSDQPQTEVDSEDRIEPSQRSLTKLDDTVDEIFDLTQESSRESNGDTHDDTCDTNTEDQDLSIFSMYKKKHRHNSIDKYRAALKNLTPSRASASVIEDTDDALSSDDLQSFNNAVSDTDKTKSRRSFMSKYEYTDPDQSTSNVQKELSNILMKDDDKIEIEISDESLGSVETNKGQSALEINDTELSDLEIDLSDISNARSSYKLDVSKLSSQSQRTTPEKRIFGNRVLDDKRKTNNTRLGIDSLASIKLDDTEFPIMKNDGEVKKTNISDQETDTECYIKSVSQLNQHKNMRQRTWGSDTDEEKTSDIYNEETDPGEMEMEDRNDQWRNSGSKMNLDTDSTDIPMACLPKTNRREVPSPDCEISGIYPPTLSTFDFAKNVSTSQTLRETSASTSRSLESAYTLRIPRDDYLKDISLLNRASDSEFNNMDFMGNMDFPDCGNSNNKSPDAGSPVVEIEEKSISEDKEKSYCFLESDTSDSGEFKLHRPKTKASISLANKSKVIRKRSRQLSCRSITPESSSTSSLRKFKRKSISENVVSITPSKGKNLLDDSFENELCRVQTPPIQQSTSSNIEQVTPQKETTAENITPLANYSAMNTPELTKELRKYGLKALKRPNAEQVLRHIYNETHPVVPVDKTVPTDSDEPSTEDERPTASKKLILRERFVAVNSRENTDDIESDCENVGSDTRSMSNDFDDNGLENYDSNTSSQSNECESLENVFQNLMKTDKSLHNKILTYEPLVLEELHSTLKAQGLNYKLNVLMDFLDEQCITFRTLASAKKNRTRRKASPTKNQGTQRRKKTLKINDQAAE